MALIAGGGSSLRGRDEAITSIDITVETLDEAPTDPRGTTLGWDAEPPSYVREVPAALSVGGRIRRWCAVRLARLAWRLAP